MIDRHLTSLNYFVSFRKSGKKDNSVLLNVFCSRPEGVGSVIYPNQSLLNGEEIHSKLLSDQPLDNWSLLERGAFQPLLENLVSLLSLSNFLFRILVKDLMKVVYKC